MRALTTLLAAPLLCLAVACGGGDVQERGVDVMEQFVEVIEGIDGPDDVDAAVEKLEKLKADTKDLEDELPSKSEMRPEIKEQMDALEARISAKMQELVKKPEMIAAMEKLGKAMGE